MKILVVLAFFRLLDGSVLTSFVKWLENGTITNNRSETPQECMENTNTIGKVFRVLTKIQLTLKIPIYKYNCTKYILFLVSLVIHIQFQICVLLLELKHVHPWRTHNYSHDRFLV